jgi:hypothetical protein
MAVGPHVLSGATNSKAGAVILLCAPFDPWIKNMHAGGATENISGASIITCRAMRKIVGPHKLKVGPWKK